MIKPLNPHEYQRLIKKKQHRDAWETHRQHLLEFIPVLMPILIFSMFLFFG